MTFGHHFGDGGDRVKTRARTIKTVIPEGQSRAEGMTVPREEEVVRNPGANKQSARPMTGQCNYDIFTVSWQETRGSARPLEVNN